MEIKAHWEQVYRSRESTALSWYQPLPARSLELITGAAAGASRCTLLDVGGGDSTLAEALVDRSSCEVTVLDLSAAALARAQAQLGPRAALVKWIEADITRAELPPGAYDIWHDRAVFHFLTAADDRARYVAVMTRALRPGGTAIIGTFALDGPSTCSGLDVARYSPETLAAAIGPEFELVRGAHDVHVTPSGAEQRFAWAVLRHLPSA